MSDIVISVENLSKQYRLGTIGSGTLSHDLNRWWARMRGEPDPTLKIGQEPVGSQQSTVNSVRSRLHPSSFIPHPSEEIWALRDVSFEVKQGEVLGIIGRNGAGKSTLLKILSRVTAPTSGEVKVKGRIASLLEVGTGFHPELTGRENIYLNGAILGMSRREIAGKFDEIVAFAEVEKFIDTPVKRYSSGMYVRLAFAVAAHLEPEILLVDEVLAVGDAAFQKKCLGKMGEVAGEGRTVIYVSHNLLQMRNLCNRGLWLGNGTLQYYGEIEYAIGNYRKSLLEDFNPGQSKSKNENTHFGFLSWKINGNSAKDLHTLLKSDAFTIEMGLKIDQRVNNGSLILVLQDSEETKIAGWHKPGLHLDPGQYSFRLEFPFFPIRSGIYYWNVAFWDGSRRVDTQILMPELLVSTEDHSGLNEEMGGIMNLPCEIEVIDK